MQNGAQEPKLLAGDLRLPEIELEELKGPSRGRVILHLAGMGLGFLLVVVGLGLGFSRSMWGALAGVPVSAGGALVAGWVTINHRFLSMMVRNRRVMVGTNAVFMGLLAVVLLVLVNFISWRHYHKWDFTRAGLFTLSAKTEQVLANLDRDVTLVSFHRTRAVPGVANTNYEYDQFMKLMDLYKLASGHVKVEYNLPDRDLESAKMAAERYGIDPNSLMFDDVFVMCGDKKKVLRLAEMVEWEFYGDYFNPQKKPRAFKGEQFVTSAIVEVTQEKQIKVYVLTGHGERSIEEPGSGGMLGLAGLLKRDNLVVETLPALASTGVPPDCDCLLVLAPQTALVAEEVEQVRQYLGRGGRLLLCDDVRGTSGLESTLEQWGVKIGNDIVISPDANLGSPVAVIAEEFADQEITRPLKGFTVLFNVARSVSAAKDARADLTVAELVKTTGASYAKTDVEAVYRTGDARKNPTTDLAGPISLAAAVEQVPDKAQQPVASGKLMRIAVFGDADAFSNDALQLPMKNADLCRNAINWLVERKELIAIESRPEAEHIMVVDDAGRKAVFWLLVVGLPLAVLLAGGVVWAMRSYGSRAAQ